MRLFSRFHRFWVFVWSVFGVGGLLLVLDELANGTADAKRLLKGVIFCIVALIMVGMIVRNRRVTNAAN